MTMKPMMAEPKLVMRAKAITRPFMDGGDPMYASSSVVMLPWGERGCVSAEDVGVALC